MDTVDVHIFLFAFMRNLHDTTVFCENKPPRYDVCSTVVTSNTMWGTYMGFNRWYLRKKIGMTH